MLEQDSDPTSSLVKMDDRGDSASCSLLLHQGYSYPHGAHNTGLRNYIQVRWSLSLTPFLYSAVYIIYRYKAGLFKDFSLSRDSLIVDFGLEVLKSRKKKKERKDLTPNLIVGMDTKDTYLSHP